MKHHSDDKRIVYVRGDPYFNGEHKLSNKQVRKIIYGKWKDKGYEFIVEKIRHSEAMKNNRIKYHLTNKSILKNNDNNENTIRIRLAITEDIISKLRRDKILLQKKLKGYDNEIKKSEVHQ